MTKKREKKEESKTKEFLGIKLDVGCGGNKQPNYVGMDKRPLEGVDIVHDIESFPWPIEDSICTDVICSHILEHIKPWLTLDFFNEMWRVCKVGARVAIQSPYGVNSLFVQDPTHCNPVNQATFQYFDPNYPLYGVYKPKPWRLYPGFPSWQSNGLIEVLMEKIEDVSVEETVERREENESSQA